MEPRKTQRDIKIAELRKLVAEGHASGVVDWEGGDELLAKIRQRKRHDRK